MYAASQFLPTIYFTKISPLEERNHTIYYCATIPNNTASGSVYLVLLGLTSFVVPLSTMSVLYYRIVRLLRARQDKLSPLCPYKETNALKVFEKSKDRVQRVLLTVVLVFIVCWTPFVVYTAVVERFVHGFPNPMDTTRLVTYSLGLFNSICNPFIYFINIRGNRVGSVGEFLKELFYDKRRADSRGQYTNARCSTTTNPHTLVEVIPNGPMTLSQNFEAGAWIPTGSTMRENDFLDSEKEALWSVDKWPSLRNISESHL